MRNLRPILFPSAVCMTALYWFSTFVILRNAPFLDGPQDEADAALAFFLGRTATALCLLILLFLVDRLMLSRLRAKPKEERLEEV